jgi:AbiV family abortive infection protein
MYGTAVGLALMARDELGKYALLLDLWVDASNGKPVTSSQVKENHLQKQKRAAFSATLADDDDAKKQQTFDKLHQLPRGSTQWEEAFEELGDTQIRRDNRERAFYVDPTEVGWSRPCVAFTAQESARILCDLNNEYRGEHDAENRKLHFQERRPGLYEALEEWTSKPNLPDPPIPPNLDGTI